MSFRLPKFPMLTIFHNPSYKVSVEALTLLKKASVKYNFNIDLVQSKTIPPTHQQVSNIIEYLGENGVQKILVPEAPPVETVEQVQKLLDAKPDLLIKPLIVDWNKGKAMVAIPPKAVVPLMVKNVGESE